MEKSYKRPVYSPGLAKQQRNVHRIEIFPDGGILAYNKNGELVGEDLLTKETEELLRQRSENRNMGENPFPARGRVGFWS